MMRETNNWDGNRFDGPLDPDFLADEHEAQYDDWAANQFERRHDEAIAEAWRSAERGPMVQSAWYDTTPLTMTVPVDVTAREVDAALRRTIFKNIGQTMYALGAAGGYSTLGRVKLLRPGLVEAESVYHIGD